MTNIWCDSKECRYNRYGQCMQDMVDVVNTICETFDTEKHIDNNRIYDLRRQRDGHRLPRD